MFAIVVDIYKAFDGVQYRHSTSHCRTVRVGSIDWIINVVR